MLGQTLMDRLGLVLLSCGKQLLWIALPLALFAVVFHGIEMIVQRRLVERFGWKAALWTGWIGTPIHETSHAVLCWVFGHQIDAIALFEPDSREGRLGYVRHSYQRGDWWQETGNLFIGLAPLAGGTLVVMLTTWLMYPELVEHFLQAGQSLQSWPGTATQQTLTESAFTESAFTGPAVSATSTGMEASATTTAPGAVAADAMRLSLWDLLQSSGYALGQVFSWQNLSTVRFWLFLYLMLCITSHMAPSSSDYQGARKGALLVLAGWLLLNVISGMLGMSIDHWGTVLTPVWMLVFSVLSLAVILGVIVSAVVYVGTVVWDQVLRQVYR